MNVADTVLFQAIILLTLFRIPRIHLGPLPKQILNRLRKENMRYKHYDKKVRKQEIFYNTELKKVYKILKKDGITLKLVSSDEMTYKEADAEADAERKIIFLKDTMKDDSSRYILETILHEVGHIVYKSQHDFCCVTCNEMNATIAGYKYLRSYGIKINAIFVTQILINTWSWYGDWSTGCRTVKLFKKGINE
jgi:hypothetical protein